VGEDRGCLYLMMPADLVERGVEACRWGRGGRGGGGGREGERARARALFGAIHNGGVQGARAWIPHHHATACFLPHT
jgi:hypothetical protein